MERSTQVSSVDALTPWAVGKYVFIAALCTGAAQRRYFIICRLSHLQVPSKRVCVCALDVDECEQSTSESHTCAAISEAHGPESYHSLVLLDRPPSTLEMLWM